MKTLLCLTALAAAIGSSSVLAAGSHGHSHGHDHQALVEQEKQTDNIFRAYFPDVATGRKAAISFHGQLMESNYDGGYLILQLTPEEQKKLEVFGFTFEKATDFIERRNQQLDQMQQLMLQPQSTAPGAQNTTQSIPGYSCYETVEETYAIASGFASTYPNLASWVDVGDSWNKTVGQGGFDIRVLKLTNKSIGGEKPILFVNSAIHAREYTTAPLTTAFARWLVEGYGTNADATWILDHHEVHLMLHANPDGRKQAETGLSWRKNVNENYCGPTSNSRGADLNRNFSFSWNSTNGQGSSGSQCNNTYRGPSPASEPEVQAIEAYVRTLWPDQRGTGKNDAAPADTSGIHLDIHSYSELILWPWGDTNQVAPNGTALQTLGRKFAFFNGYSPQQSIGLYPTDGTSDAISYGELGVAAFTFELGTSFFQSCSVYENTIKPDNLPALIYAAKVVRTPYITPQGPDVTNLALSDSADTSGVPAGTNVTLTVTASDNRFNNSNGAEPTQNVTQVQYSVNQAPWETGAALTGMTPTDGGFNEAVENATASIDTTGWAEGDYLVYVRAQDSNGVWGAVSAIFLKVNNNPPPPPPAQYCTAGGNNANEEWIARVELNGDVRTSGSSTYSDFTEAQTSQFFSVAAGNNPVSLTPAFSGSAYNEYWKIWIDLNQDGDFTDAGEEVYSSGTATSSAVSGNVVIPSSAPLGKTRMRVAMRYNAAPSPCGSFSYGEVEDYTVEIGEGDITPPPPPSDTFENTTSYNIPDNNSTGISSPITVNRTGNAGTVSVAVDITHTYKGDLIVDLVHPDGTVYNLHNRSGGSANNIQQTYTVNVGSKAASGTWNLRVRDRARQDVGTLNQWSITF